MSYVSLTMGRSFPCTSVVLRLAISTGKNLSLLPDRKARGRGTTLRSITGNMWGMCRTNLSSMAFESTACDRKPNVSGPGQAIRVFHFPSKEGGGTTMQEDVMKWVRGTLEHWTSVITGPTDYLGALFQPTNQHLWTALEFWLLMTAVGFILSTPTAFAHPGGPSEKTRIAFATLFALILSSIAAIVYHFSFVWFGGTATVSGSLVTYAYAVGPYIPLQVFAGLIVIAGIPSDLRRRAVNPSTASFAFAQALQRHNEGDTSPFTIWTGIVCVWGIRFWSLFVLYRCLSYVHALEGLEQHAKAIGVSLLISIPVGIILMRLSSLAAALNME